MRYLLGHFFCVLQKLLTKRAGRNAITCDVHQSPFHSTLILVLKDSIDGRISTIDGPN